MTEDQALHRDERVALMMESGSSEDEAQRYCDTRPELYGIRERGVEQQLTLL